MNIAQNHTQNTLVFADQWLDYVPLLSSFSNGIDLIAKVALKIIESYAPSLYESIKDDLLVKHLQDKHAFVCVLLMVPIFNIFMALKTNERSKLKEFQITLAEIKKVIGNSGSNIQANNDVLANSLQPPQDYEKYAENYRKTIEEIDQALQEDDQLDLLSKEQKDERRRAQILDYQKKTENIATSIKSLQKEIPNCRTEASRKKLENSLQIREQEQNFLVNKVSLFTSKG